MKFIELNIECNTGNDNIPEELQGQIPTETEFRPAMIRVDLIKSFYPNHTGDHTYIDLSDPDGPLFVSESIEEVKEKIKNLNI